MLMRLSNRAPFDLSLFTKPGTTVVQKAIMNMLFFWLVCSVLLLISLAVHSEVLNVSEHTVLLSFR